MKIWIFTLPEDWLFKTLRVPINTGLTFYLFQYYSQIGFVESYWELNDKNYIVSFLITQSAFLGLFYVLISKLLERPIRWLVDRQIKRTEFGQNHNTRKELVEIKELFVRIFSLKIGKQLAELELLDEKIYLEDKSNEISILIQKSSKWMALFFQILIVSVLVYQLSAWYILPIILVILLLILLYAIVVSVVLHNYEFIEKVRKGIVKRRSNMIQ